MSSRRSLFQGFAAAAILPAVTPLAVAVALEPDIMLITLRDGIKAHQARWDTLSNEGADLHIDAPRGREIHSALVDMVPAFEAMEEKLAETPARSLQGLRAKAEGLCLRMAGDAACLEPMDSDDNLA